MKEPRSGASEHREIAARRGPVSVAVVTISDSRTAETDDNRHYLTAQLEAAGHRLSAYRIVRDEPDQIGAIIDELAATDAQIILTNGGTGIAPRDTTFDVVSRKLEKVMPGFGEIFRMLSYQQVGAAAMLSRATAGIFRNKLVISVPGSPAAVQLAWEKLILPEIQHLAWEVTRTPKQS